MIGPSLGQEENITSTSRLYDEFRLSHEEEVSQENIVILDANNTISFSELNSENQPTRLEVVIVQGTWNESDENTNLTLTSDIFDNFETVDCNNGKSTTNIVQGIEGNGLGRHGLGKEFILNNSGVPAPVDKDPLADDVSETDNEDNNLMWLLNYRLDSMFNVDGVGHDHNYPGNEFDEFGKTTFRDGIGARGMPGGMFGSRIYSGEMFSGKVRRGPGATLYRRSLGNVNGTTGMHASTSPLISANSHANHHGCANALRKPPFTYTEMIEQALSESGELTVSGIYNWISEHFPFYKANDDRWKNSVRHNLSINPHFKKGSKARHGAGHLWTIATQEDRPRTASRKRRLEQFWAQTQCCHPQTSGRSSPTTLAVESITMTEDTTDVNCTSLGPKMEFSIMEDIKGDITVAMEENKENSDKRIYVPQVFCPVTHNGPKPHIVSLEQSAEEILSGVKREVEVQYLTPLQQKRASAAASSSFTINSRDPGHIPFPADFLNPVSKREVVEESGLFVLDDGTVASFIVADENFPAGVISDIENGEVIVSDNLFGEDLNFQYHEMVSPQSAQQLHV
ncbi:uncharacterized protein LOC124162612 [Ischnura elegans]|uniref:uncharacterized protein LOC124162612 n=1 Tax=Ischnura elegans TaxID=197161 RepID=UPI001ED87328|nr:uncharacterized protein LOC124162612 [Ischnura elegans]